MGHMGMNGDMGIGMPGPGPAPMMQEVPVPVMKQGHGMGGTPEQGGQMSLLDGIPGPGPGPNMIGINMGGDSQMQVSTVQ